MREVFGFRNENVIGRYKSNDINNITMVVDKQLIPSSPAINVISTRPGYLDLNREQSFRLIKNEPIGDYYQVEDEPFARGKYAMVRRCACRRTGKRFAAKFLKKRRSADSRNDILHEIAVLEACKHSSRIVRLHQVFESNHEMILLLELAVGGELQMLLDSDQVPSEAQAVRLMKQILDGLIDLHSINVAHLDLKPQNLVLTGQFPDCDVKLCDFGISRYLSGGVEVREIQGTPDYVAPEVLNFEPINLATDMWSVGVLVYVLLTGCSPFGGENKQETFCNIIKCKLDFPDDLFQDISEEAKDLMRKLMVKNPSQRLTAKQCLQHPWFQTSPDMLSTIITSPMVTSTPRTPTLSKKPAPAMEHSGEQIFEKSNQDTTSTTPLVHNFDVINNNVNIYNNRCDNELFNKGLSDNRRKSFRKNLKELAKKLEFEDVGTNKALGDTNLERNIPSRSPNSNNDDYTKITSSNIDPNRSISVGVIEENKKLPSIMDDSIIDEDVCQKSIDSSFRTTNNLQDNSVRRKGKDSLNAVKDCAKITENLHGKSFHSEKTDCPNISDEPSELANDLKENSVWSKNENKPTTDTENVGVKTNFIRADSYRSMIRANGTQTMPVSRILHYQYDRPFNIFSADKDIQNATFKFRRVYIIDDPDDLSSPPSFNGSLNSEGSSVCDSNSDTISDMSMDSSSDRSSVISLDDTFDFLNGKGRNYASCCNIWEAMKNQTTQRRWPKECSGSVQRALSKFKINNSDSDKDRVYDGSTKKKWSIFNSNSSRLSIPNMVVTKNRLMNKNINKKCVELMPERKGNVVVIREVKAVSGSEYPHCSEVKCESVQARIRRLQIRNGLQTELNKHHYNIF